jgi:hypothetical protein
MRMEMTRTPAKAEPSTQSKRRKTQVPEQYGGYSLQGIRFLQLLLSASSGTIVSLEVFEDVGTEKQNGRKTASQTKAGLVKNPISDRAPEFWKTFANWMDAIDEGTLDQCHTVFEIYVGRRHPCRIAKLFHDANTIEAAEGAIQEARRKFSEAGQHTNSGRRSPASLKSLLDRVFDPTRKSLVYIVKNFCLTFPFKDPLSDLRRSVSAKWVRPESVELIVQHAHGWVRERIDTLIQARKPAAIPVDDFNREMVSFLPRCDFRTILLSMAGKPSAAQVETERLRPYVRQLELIEAEDEDIIQAINDYLRSYIERTLWSKAGIVHDRSFEEFEEALLSFWRNKKRQNLLTRTTLSPVQQGQLLLSECCMKEQRLQGLEVPSFFTPGSYHALADDGELGWHPEYKTRLQFPRTSNGSA